MYPFAARSILRRLYFIFGLQTQKQQVPCKLALPLISALWNFPACAVWTLWMSHELIKLYFPAHFTEHQLIQFSGLLRKQLINAFRNIFCPIEEVQTTKVFQISDHCFTCNYRWEKCRQVYTFLADLSVFVLFPRETQTNSNIKDAVCWR